MQTNPQENNATVGFEISREVREKMEHAENLHVLIGETEVADLEYVDVSGKKYRFFKRGLDIVLTLLGLMVLLIPLLLVMLVIYVDDPGPVFFRQYRVGRGGKRFQIYKFRSMKMSTPKYLSTMEMDEPGKYITRVGKVLRRFSIDELPQLINVLVGDMSLVGPRPLISDEYELHEMRTRFGVYNVRPGVTGLAQINGRDTVPPAEKVHWDVRYLENFNLWMDLKILLATVPKIFGGAGVVEGFDSATSRGEEKGA